MPPPRLSFEFDPAKAASNLKQHGVDFLEAITVFNDPLSSTLADDRHSLAEVRLHDRDVFPSSTSLRRLN